MSDDLNLCPTCAQPGFEDQEGVWHCRNEACAEYGQVIREHESIPEETPASGIHPAEDVNPITDSVVDLGPEGSKRFRALLADTEAPESESFKRAVEAKLSPTDLERVKETRRRADGSDDSMSLA